MYEIKLYVSGSSGHTEKAIHDLKTLLVKTLSDEYTLEIIDVRENPQRAQEDMIYATPTASKESPPPLRRILGDFSNAGKVVLWLGLEPPKEEEAGT